MGGVDNFCWPTIEYDAEKNPDGKYKAAQLVRANWALRDYCLAFGIPLLSGKDSMYIDGNLEGPYGERRKVSGLPTLLFTVTSVITDITKCVTMDAKFPGDLVYVLGETKNELGASEYYQMLGVAGINAPKVRAEALWPQYLALHRAISEGLVSSCHAVSRGGLGVHLAMVAMAGELGMEIALPLLSAEPGLTTSQVLYSESAGRFIITVPPEKGGPFEEIFSGMKLGRAGVVTESPRLSMRGDQESPIMEEDIERLKDSWKRPFGELI
jgi:phosphoribosylformylglycinamidine synthase